MPGNARGRGARAGLVAEIGRLDKLSAATEGDTPAADDLRCGATFAGITGKPRGLAGCTVGADMTGCPAGTGRTGGPVDALRLAIGATDVNCPEGELPSTAGPRGPGLLDP